MHPAVIVCTVLMIIGIILSIWIGIEEKGSDGLIALLIVFLLVGVFGFGMTCALIPWSTKITKLPVDKVEFHVFEKNGIITMAYKGKTYNSDDITDLNVVRNLDYFAFKEDLNAYNVAIQSYLIPVEKGKIDDYIEEK